MWGYERKTKSKKKIYIVLDGGLWKKYKVQEKESVDTILDGGLWKGDKV